jgi:hypothetical protein
MDEWKAVGGDWTIANGVIYNNSNERGSKLLTGSSAWGDYAVNADEPQELSRRTASTRTEWNHGPSRRRAQSHATTLPPSSGATCRFSAPRKACPVFLVS